MSFLYEDQEQRQWIAFVRHAPTAWNRSGRLQGRTDIPLLDESVEALKNTRIHDDYIRANWFSSPLARAHQTASILSGQSVNVVDELTETNWGLYEGLDLSELKTRIKKDRLEPSRGLEMRPPDGESAGDVRQRLTRWLTSGRPKSNAVAVTHKGVIRSAISLACGWDMESPFWIEVDFRRPLLFEYSQQSDSPIRLLHANLEWDQPVVCP
ncbi:MAG: histidine phosphatase family protein [Pseudomonadota bacterium]